MSSRKRETTWVGGGVIIEPETDASTGTDEITQLIPAAALGAAVKSERTQFRIDSIYLHFHIHRILLTALDACSFLVYQMAPQENSLQPAMALDALSTLPRMYQRKNIMMHGPLPVPPLLAAGDLLSFQTDDRVLVASHQFRANRKHDTAKEVLCLVINSDVSVVLRIFVQWRILLSW